MLTLAAAASASLFFRTSSSTLNGVDAGFFAPHPCFFFFVSGGGAGGSSSGGGGGAGCSGGGGGAAESSGGGGGGAGGCSEGAGGGIEDGVSADPFDIMPSIMIRDTEWLKWVRSRPRIDRARLEFPRGTGRAKCAVTCTYARWFAHTGSWANTLIVRFKRKE